MDKQKPPLLLNQAEEAADRILKAFQQPNDLPKPLAQIFIRRKDQIPCRSWSWRNQLLVALSGYSDARGFRQWEAVGRNVKKGEKAFRILSPVTKKIEDKKTDEEKRITYGFRGTPVFGYEQTEGKPLPIPKTNASLDAWVQTLPLLEVAAAWKITVETFDGSKSWARGRFQHSGQDQLIALGVKNLATWTHELIHAADFRNGKLKENGQHWASETVAEFGGAVLLVLLGHDDEADLGGCWDYIKNHADKKGMAVLDACGFVLDRTCEAVALIMDTAEALDRVEQSGKTTERLMVHI